MCYFDSRLGTLMAQCFTHEAAQIHGRDGRAESPRCGSRGNDKLVVAVAKAFFGSNTMKKDESCQSYSAERGSHDFLNQDHASDLESISKISARS